jgi:alpha-beta hydrolase superfamily lysophospholipase
MGAKDYFAPNGLRTRGTVIVVPGRGEGHPAYTRFGSRLAYDAYRVRVADLPDLDPADVAAFRRELAARLAEAVAEISAEAADGLVRPLVLVGSDLGAAAIAALVADGGPGAGWWPQAVVLAGLPGYRARPDGGWEDELDIRTHCPAHRGVLADATALRPGQLAGPVPDELLDAAYQSTADVPQLLLTGAADPLADHDAIERAAKTLPAARLAVVRGGHHDVLNDLQHRSVAAEIVAFLEALRDDLTPAVTVETSAW